MDMKRFFLYAIVIAALALAGCGGNGGGTAMMPDPTPPDPPAMVTCPDGSTAPSMDACPAGPTPEEMALKDAQDAAMAAYMAAMTAVGGARDYVARQNAHKYAAMAKEANDAAQAATTSAMAEEYQMQAEAARDQAMEAAMMRSLGITALANKIINQSAIDNAVLEGKTGDDVPKPNSNLKARVGTALDNTAGRPPEVVTDGTSISQGANATNDGQEAASAIVDHTTTGLSFTVTRGTGGTAVLRGEDPTPLMTSGEKPSGGWPGAELVRTDNPAGKTYVNIYTDINPDTQLYTDPTPGVNTALDITTLTGDAKAIVTGADVPGDGSSFTGMYNMDSTDNNPPVAGQFNCPSGVSCSISVDEDGVIKAIQGYEFHAKAAGLTKPDADYMSWGVWLTVPDVAADGTIGAATTGAFASGNDPFNVRAELKGTATYSGDATGLYAASGYVDYFDADVNLTANFGGNVGADSGATAGTPDDNLLGSVSGTVSNIRAGGMDIDGMLTLKMARILDGATDNGRRLAGTFAGFTGSTDGILAWQ